MFEVALKMLVGNRGKYLGMIMGVFFSSLVITQQSSIFCGLMARTYGFITDTQQPDIWVMDPMVLFVDDLKPVLDTKLTQIRGIQGVQWAVPLYKGILKGRLPGGQLQNTNVIGLDDASLVGAPPEMIKGTISDLRRADSIIVDEVGARGKLAKVPATPTNPGVPLEVGDILELNDHRAVVVGITKVSRTFQSYPVVYTTYSRATTFAPQERKKLTYVLVKAKDGEDLQNVKASIERVTKLKALTKDEFSMSTVWYFLKNTGIPINFGIAIFLGLIVGTAIVGQTFYGFTVDNIKYFGTLKAMGASNFLLLKMLVLQSVVVAVIGYGLGVGVASLFYFVSLKSELAFMLLWQVLAVSASATVIICVLSACVSILKVVYLEPAIVFKGD